MQHPCTFLSFSNIWCDDKLTSDNTPPTPGIGTFLQTYFSSSALNEKVLGFCLNLTAWRVTAQLTFPLRLTPHNLDTITDCSPRPGHILFILLHFWGHFPQATEAELKNRVTFGKEFNLVKFPADTQDTGLLWMILLSGLWLGWDGEVWRSDFRWPSN